MCSPVGFKPQKSTASRPVFWRKIYFTKTGKLRHWPSIPTLIHIPYTDRWDAWVEYAAQCCSDVRRHNHSSCSGTAAFCREAISCDPPALTPSLVLALSTDWPWISLGSFPPYHRCLMGGLLLDLLIDPQPLLAWLSAWLWAWLVLASAVTGSEGLVAGSSLCPLPETQIEIWFCWINMPVHV